MLIVVVVIFIFNIVHALLASIGVFRNPAAAAFSALFGNLGPAITQDAAAARNPGLELLFSMFADMPGGYSLYFSGIVVQPPLAGQPLPQVDTSSIAGYSVFLFQQLIARILSVLVVLLVAWAAWRLARRRR